jgi:hypothetical protein
MEENMTKHFPVATFTKPLSGICSCISRTTGRYIQIKLHRAKILKLSSVLSELDPDILKDIGMDGFERLTPEQKFRKLADRRGKNFAMPHSG